MSELDAERIAKRLGLTDAVICQLQAHGYLQRLAVTAHELDARIYRAHLAYLKRDAQTSQHSYKARSGRRVTPI